MKVAAVVLMFAGVLALAGASSAFAEGGMVRADGAAGPAYQIGELPFGDGLYDE